MEQRIYVAGPMRAVRDFNFPSFAEARERLRSLGWDVVCPAERDEQKGFDPSGMTGYEDLESLGFDLDAALAQCFLDVISADAVALLPGWELSEGAKAEALVAKLTGRTCYEYFKHRPVPLEPVEYMNIQTRIENLR